MECQEIPSVVGRRQLRSRRGGKVADDMIGGGGTGAASSSSSDGRGRGDDDEQGRPRQRRLLPPRKAKDKVVYAKRQALGNVMAKNQNQSSNGHAISKQKQPPKNKRTRSKKRASKKSSRKRSHNDDEAVDPEVDATQQQQQQEGLDEEIKPKNQKKGKNKKARMNTKATNNTTIENGQNDSTKSSIGGNTQKETIAIDNDKKVQHKNNNVKWKCDFCHVAIFDTYNKALEHEKTCTGVYEESPHDIDERDKNDPVCFASGAVDLYEHHRKHEKKPSSTVHKPTYMNTTHQPYINKDMRAILIDWLVEVHLKFKLVPETLHLTVNIIDRYLSKVTIPRQELQLVGTAALLIASKYEEIYPPEIRDLIYICDSAYTKVELLDMENRVLNELEYRVTVSSAHAFLVRGLKAGHADKPIVQLSCWILDGTLLSYELLKYLPSQLAAASIYIARKTVGRRGWSPTLVKYTGYTEEGVVPVARALLADMDVRKEVWPELRAVTKKYQSPRYGCIADRTLCSDF